MIKNKYTERQKQLMRSKTHGLIKRGFIKKHPCYICLDKNAQAHHENYDNPYAISWLCRACHLDHHMDLRYPNTIRKQLRLI